MRIYNKEEEVEDDIPSLDDNRLTNGCVSPSDLDVFSDQAEIEHHKNHPHKHRSTQDNQRSSEDNLLSKFSHLDL